MFFMLHPALIFIISDLNLYAKEKFNIDLVITQTVSTVEQDRKLNRVSAAHRSFAAADIRTKDLDPFVVQDLIQYINSKEEYKKYRYLSKSGIKRLAYYHVGSAEHLHIALHRKYFNFGIKSE